MRKLLVILLFVVGAFAAGKADIAPQQNRVESEVVDLHHEQLCCSHRHNVDAERTSSVTIPSVRTTTAHSARLMQQRMVVLSSREHHQTTSNYSVAHFIHRLGSLARAIDLYLYIFCVLRL